MVISLTGKASLAIFDPEARCAAAVIAGDHVDARADEFGHVKPAADIGHEIAGRRRAGGQIAIARRRRRRARKAARAAFPVGCQGRAGGPMRRSRSQPVSTPSSMSLRWHPAVLRHRTDAKPDRGGASGSSMMAMPGAEQLLAQPSFRKAGAACDRRAGRPRRRGDRRGSKRRAVEDHRQRLRSDLAWLQPRDRPFARLTSDILWRLEIAWMDRRMRNHSRAPCRCRRRQLRRRSQKRACADRRPRKPFDPQQAIAAVGNGGVRAPRFCNAGDRERGRFRIDCQAPQLRLRPGAPRLQDRDREIPALSTPQDARPANGSGGAAVPSRRRVRPAVSSASASSLLPDMIAEELPTKTRKPTSRASACSSFSSMPSLTATSMRRRSTAKRVGGGGAEPLGARDEIFGKCQQFSHSS